MDSNPSAPFWTRYCAFVVDYLLVQAVAAPVAYGVVRILDPDWEWPEPFLAWLLLVAIYVGVTVSYFAFFESSGLRATPGKRVFGLRVSFDEDGASVRRRAVLRIFLKLVHLAGILLAAPVTAALTKRSAAEYLDMAVVPGLVMYILARTVEPLSGQGVGDFMEMEVCVSFIEAALTAIVLAFVPFIRSRCRSAGTLFQHVLVLWCLVQILPESLRLDDSLSVFVFARVTHLGLAVTLGVTLLRLLVKNGKQIGAKGVALDVLGLAAGLGLAIGAIFALDKTNWPKLLVYAMMVAALVWLGYVICRRIHKEDVRA